MRLFSHNIYKLYMCRFCILWENSLIRYPPSHYRIQSSFYILRCQIELWKNNGFRPGNTFVHWFDIICIILYSSLAQPDVECIYCFWFSLYYFVAIRNMPFPLHWQLLVPFTFHKILNFPHIIRNILRRASSFALYFSTVSSSQVLKNLFRIF